MNHIPASVGLCNTAKYDLTHSPRNIAIRSGRVPAYLWFMSSRILDRGKWGTTGLAAGSGIPVFPEGFADGDKHPSPDKLRPRPKPHPLLIYAFVTLLYLSSFIPVGDILSIPARFRVFVNCDLIIFGVREMRYNRAHSRLLCTRISAGVFMRVIKVPANDKHQPGPEYETGYPGHYADKTAGMSGRKRTRPANDWTGCRNHPGPSTTIRENPEKI